MLHAGGMQRHEKLFMNSTSLSILKIGLQWTELGDDL
jgi:hypothetical protein